MKTVHVHVHGALVQDDAGYEALTAKANSYKRDAQGKFATSSGTGEQHAATAELHTSLAGRKGTDHPDHAHHLAAAEAHKQASQFLAQANKAQHPGSAIAANEAAKKARQHEAQLKKGKTDPDEVKRQNAQMYRPGVHKEIDQQLADFNAKHEKPAKKTAAKKTKDAAPCGCGGHNTKDDDMGLSKQTMDSLAIVRAYVGDSWEEAKHPRAANGEFGSSTGETSHLTSEHQAIVSTLDQKMGAYVAKTRRIFGESVKMNIMKREAMAQLVASGVSASQAQTITQSSLDKAMALYRTKRNPK